MSRPALGDFRPGVLGPLTDLNKPLCPSGSAEREEDLLLRYKSQGPRRQRHGQRAKSFQIYRWGDSRPSRITLGRYARGLTAGLTIDRHARPRQTPP